ncbi:Crp/Fnr family transcriptional regulator [Arcicella lustrica]|uniref:Crp/Fnr family transcriptional regulator n=2 Tax=Arcicella TaxID=217140 RepID=A0ABU5SKE6_9BACT|nr:Crp/Fnr family transcriptional regulator [Arcicella sp. DC25W]MEA5427771.1 Crp/Fnr family transcriptional regulator [Arcicella sp. DC25W]
MSAFLGKHIAQQISISETDITQILTYFKPRVYEKKACLLQENQSCKTLYFVDRGCLRLFFCDDKGIEQTIQFAIEGWWMTDLTAFHSGKTAEFSIQAIETTEVMEIDRDTLEELLKDFPQMERYFNKIYQRAYAASLLRVKHIFTFSKEAFYQLFSSKYPQFIQRIPQKILASFLGFTPEYLSELRKKSMKH